MADAPALDATDSARDLATEHGIDLVAAVAAGEITPTGKDGGILKADVQMHIDALAEDEEQDEPEQAGAAARTSGTADFTLAADAEAGTVYTGSIPRMLTHGRRLRLPTGDPSIRALVSRGTLVPA